MPSNPAHLSRLLEERKQKGLLRRLHVAAPVVDFSSNDYLGFVFNSLISKELAGLDCSSGSSGSRLISGNSSLFESLEKDIAAFHGAEAALIFNSGYDANVGLLSSVPQKNDLILYDELIHASMHDGIGLGYAKHFKFRHNDVSHLAALLERHRPHFTEIYIAIESVYSMDGDSAPLKEMADLARTFNAHLIVDEAHAIGVMGKQGSGLCDAAGIADSCFARVYTYGKAMGCHGAAVLGSELLRTYLINFARSFIYTTALPEHSLRCIQTAYKLLADQTMQEQLQANIRYFNEKTAGNPHFIQSHSAIHCYVLPGNERVQAMEEKLQAAGIFAKSIKSPTVKAGEERLRICLHAFNTFEEIDSLLNILSKA